MPNLGLTNTEGTIIGWMREDGDLVEKGDVVVEISTDKIATEIEASESGVLRIVHPDDAVVPIAEVIGYILQPGEELPEEPEQGEPEGGGGGRNISRCCACPWRGHWPGIR
jgi:pyruvate dehydrogenase E2 component (dihydrolipoamide acetyltransferase)